MLMVFVMITEYKNNPVSIVTSRIQNAFKRYTLDGIFIDTIDLPVYGRARVYSEYLYAAVLQSQSRLWQQSGFVTILDKNNKVVSNIACTGN